jgi:hypothetical protein
MREKRFFIVLVPESASIAPRGLQKCFDQHAKIRASSQDTVAETFPPVVDRLAAQNADFGLELREMLKVTPLAQEICTVFEGNHGKTRRFQPERGKSRRASWLLVVAALSQLWRGPFARHRQQQQKWLPKATN